MRYNKLARDKIPEIIKAKGGKPKIHFASKAEYWQKLKQKLKEEIDEFMAKESAEELADILEVIEAIGNFKKIKMKKLLMLKQKKAKARGKFKKRIILDEA